MKKDKKWAYGLKTGKYKYSPERLGGTLITVGKKSYSLKNVCVDQQEGAVKTSALFKKFIAGKTVRIQRGKENGIFHTTKGLV